MIEQKKKLIKRLKTAEFAEYFLVKPETVLKRYCLTGSYHDYIPQKLASGRLSWPIPSTNDGEI